MDPSLPAELSAVPAPLLRARPSRDSDGDTAAHEDDGPRGARVPRSPDSGRGMLPWLWLLLRLGAPDQRGRGAKRLHSPHL